MIKAIIFDCFGVLYPVYIDDWYKRTKSIYNLDRNVLDNLNLQIDLGKITQRQFYEALSSEIKIPIDRIQHEIEQNITLDTKLLNLITKLKNKYLIGLLSNAGKEEISVIYSDNIADLFDSITVSYEAQCVKPDVKIFNIATQRLNVDPKECIFIDDNNENLEAAKTIGISTIFYPGYSKIPKELIKLAVS